MYRRNIILVNLYLVLLIVSSLHMTNGAEKTTIFQGILAYMNGFSECIVRVINFPGNNFDPTRLTRPIVLSRYYSFSDLHIIFPRELRSQNRTELEDKYMQCIHSSNTFKFKSSKRNGYCEAELFIEPPSRKCTKRKINIGNWNMTVEFQPSWIWSRIYGNFNV